MKRDLENHPILLLNARRPDYSGEPVGCTPYDVYSAQALRRALEAAGYVVELRIWVTRQRSEPGASGRVRWLPGFVELPRDAG